MSGIDPECWKRVIEHLDHMLELPEPDWAAYLAALHQEDPATATHVGRLLSARSAPRFAEFLSGSTPLPAPETAAMHLVGRHVGPYVIEAEIGHGGMGSVWRARRADGRFESRVAVKLPYLAWLGNAGAQRFLLEGRLLGRLDHPNIARLIDAGVLEGTQPYLVLEYVEGRPIDDYCAAQQLDERARVRLFLNVLSAVGHAHRQLIIHRDIKPANVFVTEDGTVKLLDFGVAKMLTPGADELPAARAESRILTPEFAAPEQWLGETITTATDIYALGLTLYLVLTGRHPLAAPGHNAGEVMRLPAESDPPRPSSFKRELRGDLDNILAKTLRRRPQERYASVDGFAEDLRRFLANEPVSAVPDTLSYRVGKFARRHRAGVATATLMAAVLVSAVVMTSWQMIEARRQRDDAQFQERRAESANEFLNALLLSDGGPERPALSTTERLALGARMLESQYSGEPGFAGRMLVQLADQYRGMNDSPAAVALDERAYQMGKSIGDAELMALSQCAAAYAEGVNGVTDRAPERLLVAQRLLANMPRPSLVLQVACLQAQAELAIQTGNFALGETELGQARHLLEQSGQTYSAAYTSVLTDLGNVYNQTSRLREALVMAELIGATHERLGRGGTTARVMALQNQATVLFGMGELRRALQLYDEARRRFEVVYAESTVPVSLLVNRAAVLNRLGQDTEALALAREAAARAQRTDNRLWLFRAQRVACLTYLSMGQLDEAQAALDATAAALDATAATNSRLLTQLDLLRAQLWLARGNAGEAIRSVESALARSGFPASKRFADAQVAFTIKATAALEAGRLAEAREDAGTALSIAETLARAPDSSADVGEAALLLAKTELAQGRAIDARPLLERAVRSLSNGVGAEHTLTREAQRCRRELQSWPTRNGSRSPCCSGSAAGPSCAAPRP